MVDRRAFQREAEKLLGELRARVEGGDSKSLFRAIYLCGRARLVMPDWLVAAFERGLSEVEHYRVRSWDNAFGAPKLPEGKHLDALRIRELRFHLFHVVEAIRLDDPTRALDDELFEEVGGRFGCRKSLAKKLYYEARAEGARPLWPFMATKE